MLNSDYIPERGDIIWLNFNPQSGREQMGRRLALVISPQSYNGKVGLVLVCPITSQIKGYPFEVELTNSITKGVVISDQIKSLDWRMRNAEFIERLKLEKVVEVISKFSTLVM
jgi:mRNA interferase MazF